MWILNDGDNAVRVKSLTRIAFQGQIFKMKSLLVDVIRRGQWQRETDKVFRVIVQVKLIFTAWACMIAPGQVWWKDQDLNLHWNY